MCRRLERTRSTLEDGVLRLGGKIREVKQKFGRLCFFYSLPSTVPDAMRRAFVRRVRQAEETSVRICEVCSRPGELVCEAGLYFTACVTCREASRIQRGANS